MQGAAPRALASGRGQPWTRGTRGGAESSRWPHGLSCVSGLGAAVRAECREDAVPRVEARPTRHLCPAHLCPARARYAGGRPPRHRSASRSPPFKGCSGICKGRTPGAQRGPQGPRSTPWCVCQGSPAVCIPRPPSLKEAQLSRPSSPPPPAFSVKRLTRPRKLLSTFIPCRP